MLSYKPMTAVSQAESSALLCALCDALPPIIDGLAVYAREAEQDGKHGNAALAWAFRQAGLIGLGALERHLGRPRTFRSARMER